MSEQRFIEIDKEARSLKKEIDDTLHRYGTFEDDDGCGNINNKTVEDKIEGLKEDVKNLKKLKKQQKKLKKLEYEKEEVLREIDRERDSHHKKRK